MLLYIETKKQMSNLAEITKLIHSLKSEKEISLFLSEVLTMPEISTLSKRWRILKMLNQGFTQRAIANELNVSLCKVTRGAKILKNKDAITTQYLIKENNYDKHSTKQ